MKKILLTLALAAFAMTANAQWVLGGNIGVDHSNNHTTDYALGGTASTNISIMPKIGYWLNDDMQLGIQLGYTQSYNRNYLTDVDSYTSNTGSALEFTPYFRYNVANWKNFTVFCEAQLNLTLGLESHGYNSVTETTTDAGDSYTSFGLAVIPGLNYAFTDHISMDIYVNLLALYANFYSDDNTGSHDWGFGLNMDAQTVNAHLNNFAIGFNYSF